MVKRLFEVCRGCLGSGTIEETHKCSCNDNKEKPEGFHCENCQDVGLIKSQALCKLCKGKGKIDVTGPRKVTIEQGVIYMDGNISLSCPFLHGDTCSDQCTCFSIKQSQDTRRYYAVCSHHNPDFIIGEVEIEEQMLESK